MDLYTKRVMPESAAAGMIGMGVSEEQLGDRRRIVPVSLDIGDDAFRLDSAARVKQREFTASIEKIDMAIKFVGNAEPHSAAADQGNMWSKFHVRVTPRGMLSFMTG